MYELFEARTSGLNDSRIRHSPEAPANHSSRLMGRAGREPGMRVTLVRPSNVKVTPSSRCSHAVGDVHIRSNFDLVDCVFWDAWNVYIGTCEFVFALATFSLRLWFGRRGIGIRVVFISVRLSFALVGRGGMLDQRCFEMNTVGSASGESDTCMPSGS